LYLFLFSNKIYSKALVVPLKKPIQEGCEGALIACVTCSTHLTGVRSPSVLVAWKGSKASSRLYGVKQRNC
jgi:hypothetical protein